MDPPGFELVSDDPNIASGSANEREMLATLRAAAANTNFWSEYCGIGSG